MKTKASLFLGHSNCQQIQVFSSQLYSQNLQNVQLFLTTFSGKNVAILYFVLYPLFFRNFHISHPNLYYMAVPDKSVCLISTS